jgi:hypothetical protein
MVVQLQQLPMQTNECSLKKKRIAWTRYDSDERVGWALNTVRLESTVNLKKDVGESTAPPLST